MSVISLIVLGIDDTLTVSGTLSDVSQGGIPIINHTVEIRVDSANMGVSPITIEVYTNDQGYFSENIPLPPGYEFGIVTSTTKDPCSNNNVTKGEIYYPGNYEINFIFELCDTSQNCVSNFFYFPTGYNPHEYKFIDLSTGNPDNWEWDFGDGTYSYIQNPIHTFPDTADYFVCLTMSNSSTGCSDTYCEFVQVREPDCEAAYDYMANPVNPLEIQFTDLSTGSDITNWLWTFGDGYESNEQNPVHVYNSQGIYNVCLMITSAQNGTFPCYDIHCSSITVEAPPPCNAGFNAVLDSTTNTQNKYSFFDTSVGEIISWTWNFGDGSISTEQNPVYKYANGGIYEVCLVVESLTGCIDTICDFIVTPAYLHFGGFAIMDNKPMNNPSHEGDTAIAYLYRFNSPTSITAVDTNIFYEYGYYWFANVLEGNYLIKIGLTENSAHYNNYMPTYYVDKETWYYADFMNHYDTNSYSNDLKLIYVPDNLTGPGKISGTLYENYRPSYESNRTIDNTLIMLSANGSIASYTHTDKNGYFEFNNLPLGTYYVKAEYIGLYSQNYMVNLTSSQPANNNVSLQLFQNNSYGIGDLSSVDNFVISEIYPNPVNDKLTFEINSRTNFSAHLRIIDIFGKTVYKDILSVDDESSTINIDVSMLSNGLYMLQLQNKETLENIIKKFIK